MRNKYTLGLNFLHSDSSACIFKNNILLAASEEERFTRVKHTSNFPINSIKFCLMEANIDISQVDLVTINSNPFSSLTKKLLFVLKNPTSLKIALSSLINSKKKIDIKKTISNLDNNKVFKGKIKYIDHHESHIASSLFFSDFSECANLSIDGFGDFSSCAYGLYRNKNLKIDKKIYFPHSLGIFYQSLTQFLGFKSYGDEYKLMGLSSYGNPKYINEISEMIKKTNTGFKLNLDYFLHHKKKIFKVNDQGQFEYENLYSKKIYDLLGAERLTNEEISQRHLDLAKSTQVIYEDVLFHIVNKIYKKYKVENLTISGGCAMNSLANGKIIHNSKFKKIYVCPSPGDAGGSIGSACIFLHRENKKNFNVENYSSLGPSYSNEYVSDLINKKKLKDKFDIKFLEYDDLYPYVVKKLVEENIVGWFQGKTEWGPRALGCRSILADPRNKDIKEIINNKIKRRESFRPFAPSIIQEHVKSWFEEDVSVPYMSEVKMIKKDKRHLIPGVTHVDGSGRLQTVTKDQNLHYYNLINEFYNITNVPIILNTSFNENEPIVNNPDEALSCYERTNMDLLVMGNWVIYRK
jgi:carbamoyltransferase